MPDSYRVPARGERPARGDPGKARVQQQVFNSTVCLPLLLFIFPSLNLKTDVLGRDQQVGRQAGLWGSRLACRQGSRDGLSCLLVICGNCRR